MNDRLYAEECVNDTYLAAWNAMPPEKPNPLKAFILRIVRNISVAKYHANTSQKRNSQYDVALDELESCLTSSVPMELEARELTEHLDGFLNTLDRDSRFMFLCRYWCSESLSDIGEKFATNPHNVSVRLSRIQNKLKKYLIKEGFAV